MGALKAVGDCSDATDCRLYFNVNGERDRYTYDDGGGAYENTPYTRIIYFDKVPGDQQVRVRSRVYWRATGQRDVQEALVETYLFNIYGS